MKLTPEELGCINDASDQPKFLQIAERVQELIHSGRLNLGDRLPSVNEIITHFSVSRDTAVKAYQELKDRGVIESTPSKACFVSNVLLHEDLKRVLFLIDSQTFYKEKMYFGLIDTLRGGYYVDIMAHGDNFDILKSIYEKYKAMRNCTAFLVIPTSSQSQEHEYFRYINPGNLLFLDRHLPGLKHPASWQDFKNGFYGALVAKTSVLEKYERIVFLTKYFTNPIIEEMNEGFSRYAETANRPYAHQMTRFSDREIRGKIDLQKGDLFFILDDHLLAATLDACAEKGFTPGKEVGIVAINDGPLYDHLPVPISVLTADFYQIGVEAARYVMDGTIPSGPVETRLIVRASL